jgi:hypothetical protein
MKKQQTFTIAEFMAYNSNDARVLDRAVGHIKRNHRAYTQLVVLVAFILITGSPEVVVEAYDSGAMAEVSRAPYEATVYMGKMALIISTVLEITRSLTIGGN